MLEKLRDRRASFSEVAGGEEAALDLDAFKVRAASLGGRECNRNRNLLTTYGELPSGSTNPLQEHLLTRSLAIASRWCSC